MRDGVELAADIYLPHGDGPWSAIVARTPYNKNTQDAFERAMRFTKAGHAFVWMDVRGRGDSDGEFAPYRNEGRDGYDAIEWSAAQHWCNGEVATWGQSYLGWSQWLTALEHPPHLRAMMVRTSPADPFAEWPAGCPPIPTISWFRKVDGRVSQYVEGTDWDRIYEHLPLLTMDDAAGFTSPCWRADLSHPPEDDYWEPLRYQERLEEVDVPVMHVSGWYDDCQLGAVRNFARMCEVGGTEASRRGQALVMGPWDHRLTRQGGRLVGEVDFGPAAVFDVDTEEIEWLRAQLTDDERTQRGPLARIFMMGENRWRDEPTWPPARAVLTSFYLSSTRGANTRLGDGSLASVSLQSGLERDRYTYDPADPVPYLSAGTSAQIGGPDDYAEVELRDDVLVYSSPELPEPLTVAGPVALRLWVSSSAVDTDFTGKLLDVHPDGTARRLLDGMTRMRFRDGMVHPTPIAPGELYEIEIDLWQTAHVFLRGHRVRLEVSSSAFPKYPRNLNRGEAIATETEWSLAENSVWHTGTFPSRLILPVLP